VRSSSVFNFASNYNVTCYREVYTFGILQGALLQALQLYDKRKCYDVEIKFQLDATEGYVSGLQDAAASCKPNT